MEVLAITAFMALLNVIAAFALRRQNATIAQLRQANDTLRRRIAPLDHDGDGKPGGSKPKTFRQMLDSEAKARDELKGYRTPKTNPFRQAES